MLVAKKQTTFNGNLQFILREMVQNILHNNYNVVFESTPGS